MLYRSQYKAGMTREDEQILRKLRCRGFAVAIFSPIDVGDPLNRGAIEKSMVNAGRETLKTIREDSKDVGRTR